jgi:predicted secreted hydrolase
LSLLADALLLGGAAALAGWGGINGPAHALPAKALVFPRDRGAHPGFRTEWWYITGQARRQRGRDRVFGFQLTFFRSRVDATQGMASKFAAKQLLFAHAAITDVQGKKLWHDQRIARDGFGVASAGEQDMALKLRDWSLKAEGGKYTAELPATDFAIKLQFEETQAVLLQGNKACRAKALKKSRPATTTASRSSPRAAACKSKAGTST